MIEIEVRGIPCVFNDTVLDDFETLELLVDMERGDVSAMVGFARRIFGEEQLDNVKSQLRGEDGVCRLTTMFPFIRECIDAAAKAKKSEAKN